MKKLSVITLIILTSLLFSFKANDNGIWIADKSHAKLGFTVTHMMVSDVEGWFNTFDAKITASRDDFSDAVAEMTADVNSINTENAMRDKDLKSASYFDAAKYPNITFKSTSFKKIDAQNYQVKGNLTIHGITKMIELKAFCRMGTNPKTNKTIAGFRVTGMIKRSDFGIAPNVTSAIISDEVTILSNAEFIKN